MYIKTFVEITKKAWIETNSSYTGLLRLFRNTNTASTPRMLKNKLIRNP